MAKKKFKAKKWAGILAMVIGVIVGVGIGGLFVAGGFLNVVILNLLPLIVHQVVGWVVIVGTILSAVLSFMK